VMRFTADNIVGTDFVFWVRFAINGIFGVFYNAGQFSAGDDRCLTFHNVDHICNFRVDFGIARTKIGADTRHESKVPCAFITVV